MLLYDIYIYTCYLINEIGYTYIYIYIYIYYIYIYIYIYIRVILNASLTPLCFKIKFKEDGVQKLN